MLMFVAFSTLLVAANAGLLPAAVQHTQLLQAAPIAYAHALEEQHSPAQYDFSYSVNDPHTGDVKEQHESRQGDNVQGEYSLVEPDGQRRTVQYTADAINGFNAIVHRDGLSQHSTPVVATVAHAATPVVHHGLPTVTLAHRAAIATPLTTTTYTAAHPQLAAPIAYTQKYAAPLAATTTTYHAAQPQIAYAQHATPIAYAQHPVAAPVAYAQHQVATPVAYAQHHVATAPSALTYTQHQVAAPAVAYTSATSPLLATSHASVSHQGLGLSYSY